MTATQFSNDDFTLARAIDALMAHDHGATDSGISSPSVRAAVRKHLEGMDNNEHRRFCAAYARRILSDSAIDQGHGIEDVVEFAGWLETLAREG